MGPGLRCFAVALCMATCGCASNELLVKKQMEMDARLEQLIQANAGTNTRIAEMTSELKDLQGRVKAHAADLEVVKPGLREVRSSLDSAPHVAGKTGAPATSKIIVVDKGAPTSDQNAVEQEVYMKAFGLFSVNNYGGAIDAFEEFLKTYPSSEYAVNAQYWIGECFYTQREYTKALEAFTKVLDRYPNGKKVPDAMLKIGFSHISLDQQEKARAALETLVEKHPNSPAAVKARERLTRN